MPSPSSNRRSSFIWNHFTRSEKNATCRLCQQTLSFSGSSSNLKRHLKAKHPTLHLEHLERRSRSPSDDRHFGHINSLQTSAAVPSASISFENQGTRSDSLSETESTVSFGPPSPPTAAQQSMSRHIIKPISLNKSRGIDMQLLKMICKDYHPFSLVEDKEFQNLIKALSPNYSLPSRKVLSNSLLPAVYNELFDKVKLNLAGAEAVSLSSDEWTNINNISFYTLTAHFIGENSQLHSYLLECSQFEHGHTAQNISHWVDSVVRKFDIHFKIIAIVTDNAAKMKAAADILNIRHLPCFANSLNLIVQHAINASIQKIVEEVKSTVTYFKESSFALTKFTFMQENLKKDKLKLKMDVPTRWNSTFNMLERFLINKEPIISSLTILGKTTFKLLNRDWEIIKQAVEILSVFDEVTNDVSAEKYLPLSKMAVLVRLMTRKIKSSKEKSKDCCLEINKLLDELLHGLTEQFGDESSCNSDLVTQATLLDPRFKVQGFGEDHEKYPDCYNNILEQMKPLIEQQTTSQSEIPPVGPRPTSTSGESSIWEDFDESVSKLQGEGKHDPESAAIAEYNQYMSEAYLLRNNDPLAWWNARKLIYPTLYHIVVERLCIPATSVPCELIYSKAGQIRTERRNRLSASKISQILFLNQNME